MTLSFSKRDILLIFLTLGLGFIGGVAAGVSMVSGQLPAEVSALILGLAIAVLTGLIALVRQIGDNILRSLSHNTNLTKQTLGATESIQVATVDRLDYDRLRRMEAAMLTLPDCQPCRDAIVQMTERRRLYPNAQEPRNG